MIEERDVTAAPAGRPWEGPEQFLREAYEAQRSRFDQQPAETRHAVEAEARRLGDLLCKSEPVWRTTYVLPEVVAVGPDRALRTVPPELRFQHVGTWIDRLRGRGLRSALRRQLLELEQSSDRSLATGAKLIRHATAWWIIHRVSPIPHLPSPQHEAGLAGPSKGNGNHGVSESADQSEPPAPDWDGEAQEHLAEQDMPEGRFSVPAWAAFDDHDQMLVDTPAQAESFLGLLQDTLAGLRAAISLAPYLIADDVYQAKRAGLLVQLGEQGRALARYETRQIISSLERRAADGQLNRGLTVSLPYYDDQTLRLMPRTFEIIPAGRIMYVAALGVRAVQDEQAKVAQDTRLSSATRDHLLEELEMLMRAFRDPARPPAS